MTKGDSSFGAGVSFFNCENMHEFLRDIQVFVLALDLAFCGI